MMRGRRPHVMPTLAKEARPHLKIPAGTLTNMNHIKASGVNSNVDNIIANMATYLP